MVGVHRPILVTVSVFKAAYENLHINPLLRARSLISLSLKLFRNRFSVSFIQCEAENVISILIITLMYITSLSYTDIAADIKYYSEKLYKARKFIFN